MVGNQNTWYTKDGCYKSETNGTFTQWQLYLNQDNKLYSKVSASKDVFYTDASVYNDTITDVTLHRGSTIILGYICDELIWKTKGGIQKYYFSKKLPVDSKLFVNHKYGDWYAYLAKANAVPLKMVVENPQLIMVSTAMVIKPMKLDQSFFVLPAGMQVIKSPY
jgi:hypothetical protein